MDDVHVNIPAESGGGTTARADEHPAQGSVPEPATPEDRFRLVRTVWRATEKGRIWIAVMLAEADERQEYLLLGYEKFEEYAAELGIPESTARKLRIVGSTFGRRLLEPPVILHPEVTVESLYASARRVRRRQAETIFVTVARPSR